MSPVELMENFQMLISWEDKYRYLIELGEKMKEFPESEKTDANKVLGCQSQVWISHKVENGRHYFNATSDAQIVRGLQAVLLVFIDGHTKEEILAVDMHSIFKRLGLEEHLSPSRRNGFLAMTNRIVSLIF